MTPPPRRTPRPWTRRAWLSASAFAAGAFASGCSRPGGASVIKLAHGLDTSHPVHKGMEYFARRVAEKSAGAIDVQVYAGGQLGSERECVELLQIGGLGMTKASSAALESFAPEYRVYGLPFLFRDEAHRWAVQNGPVGRGILGSAEARFLKGLCYYDAGARSFYTVDRRIERPEDLAGLKIRTQESQMAFRMVRALGASATPVAWGELYTALQQGVVDGAENNPPSFHLSRHYELCRYYTLNEHTAVPDVLLISTHLWARLSEDGRRWVQEAADESALHQRGLWAGATESALAAVAAAGVEIVRPDKEAFRRKVEGVAAEVSREQPLVGRLLRGIVEAGA